MKLIVLLGLFAVFLKLNAESDYFIDVSDETDSDEKYASLYQTVDDADEAESGEVPETLLKPINASDETETDEVNANLLNDISVSDETESDDVNENLFDDISASDETETDQVDESFKLDDKVLQEIRTKQGSSIIATEEETPEGGSENHPPVFSKNLYFANYTLDNTLEMVENITIAYGAKENMIVVQSGYKDHFKISQNSSSMEEFNVEILKQLTKDILKDNYIVIDIKAQTDGSTHEGLTTLLINLPNEEDSIDHPPIFSKGIYYANYTLNHELKMNEKIAVKYGAKEKMTVRQSGYEEYFSVSQNSLVPEELDVKIVKPLTEDILKENYIVIDIESQNEGSEYLGLTTLLINLPNEEDSIDHPPIFSKGIYYANYTSNHELKMNEKIAVKYGAKEKMTVRQSGYEEYFSVSQNSLVPEELDVKIVKPLTEEILKENYIVIDIESQNEGSTYLGLTTLLIDLASEKDDSSDLHPPVFSKSAYFADYAENHTLKMEETIIIKHGASDKTIVRQSGYEEYIKIELNVSNNTELLVKIIKPLSNETLENGLIVIEIIAENEGLSIPSRSNLIIRLENDSGKLSNCYEVVHILGISIGASIFPLVLFLSSITLIGFVNVILLALYFKKNRARSSIA